MQRKLWHNADILKLYRSDITRHTLIAAEKTGQIPQAERIKRGKLESRAWRLESLHKIGAKYGFLKSPNKCHSIAVYTAKGGVLKTTISYNFARMLALHGIQTIIVGLDAQGSITEMALNPMSNSSQSIENIRYRSVGDLIDEYKGKKTIDIDACIVSTDLPCLDILPETPSLTLAQKRMIDMHNREGFLKNKILPSLKDRGYQVVIWDNGPNWSILTENCLAAADIVISPIGCEPGSYQALDNNLSAILDFRDELHLKWKRFILVPTLLEKTKLSSQIHASYLQSYNNNDEWSDLYITTSSVRRATSGAEAFATGQSIFELAPTTALADDYYELCSEVWTEILKTED